MSDDADFGLVMPFVTCASKGGPHDDESYVCGYEMGAMSVTLKLASENNCLPMSMTLHRSNMDQAELLSMRYGYTMGIHDDDGEWIGVDFIHIAITFPGEVGEES